MSDQEIIEAANETAYAFNEGDWDRVKASLKEDFVYDEVCSGRIANYKVCVTICPFTKK